MADSDDDQGGVARQLLAPRRSHCTQQRERFQVDADELDAGLATRGDVAVDELAVGNDEQYALHRLAFLVLRLPEDLVVEHRLLDLDREGLLCAEANRVLELLRVVDADDLERAHADAVVRNAEPDVALRQLVRLEERAQDLCEDIRLAQLAADDDPRLDLLPRELHELGAPVVLHPRRRDLRRADLQSDEPLRH